MADIRIVYDAKLKRPGCVLLQAAYGATSGVANMFDANHWLIAPTPDLKGYIIPEERLPDLVRITEEAAKEREIENGR